MLIPIGTNVKLRRKPVGNWILVGLNVLVFILVNKLRVPLFDHLLPPLNASVPTLFEYISYQFRHGDFWHLAGNMLFLWVFGNAVCERMGSWNYVVFYLAGGIFAGWVFALNNSNALVGASGAIAAVTTAFLVLFPRVHITLLFWMVIVFTMQIPAMFFIVFKIILWDNIIAPSLDQSGVVSNVGYSAHLGGYVFGLVVVLLMLSLRGLPRTQLDILALWDRWRRRAGLGTGPAFEPVAARPVVARELRSAPLEPLELTPAERCREDLLDRLSEHDLSEAARLYQQLLTFDTNHVLPRPQQLELANHLAQSGEYGLAVRAYEDYLETYPGAADAAQVRLYAGLLARRYLHDPLRAVRHLSEALEHLTNEAQRRLAEDELRAANADISGPPETGAGSGN